MTTPAPLSGLDELFAFLRFGSVSADSGQAPAMAACAEWLAARLRHFGLAAEVRPTAGYPVVLARSPKLEGRPTVLIYGHYDVQPADPIELWTHPPFEPEVRDGLIYARGACDNKGQILAHILGVAETLQAEGSLPCNVVFLVEGEEEVGSPNLAPFLRQHRAELACDVVLISDTSMAGPGCPTFTYGLRGIAACEIEWTGPQRDLHSGFYGGAVLNPLRAMAGLLAGLHRPDGSVAIDGFYDKVRPIEDWERAAWRRLPMTDAQFLAVTGAPALGVEAGYTAIEAVAGRPTAEINGCWGGYQGEGSKTVLPSRAHAKLTFRLVPDQVPAEILQLVENHLRRHLPRGVTMAFAPGHGGQPYLVDPNTGYGRAAQNALRRVFKGTDPYLVREGGSIPIVCDFKSILGADTILLGLALPTANMHSPDENFPVAHLRLGMDLNREVLREIAGHSS